MKERTLRRKLTRLLSAAIAASGAAAGCGGTDVSLFDAPLCVMSHLSVEGLQPAMPVDYVELRRTDPIGNGVSVAASAGSKCATATDKATCNSNLSSLTSTSGFHLECLPGQCFYYLATTRADTVAAVSSADGVKTFLAPVDTQQEAALLSFAAGYDLSCSEKDKGGIRRDPGGDGYEVLATKMTRDCDPIEITRFVLHVSKAGAISVVSSSVISSQAGVCVGRRPAGLHSEDGGEASGEGALAAAEFLAASAELEAAAVSAFEILGSELAAHGAPLALRHAAARAARDEVRHARVTARLARRYGGHPGAPRIEPRAVRELAEVALENAVEGCVRETYGALVALWQARHAHDQAVARAMREIARDEVRHAALSWSVAEWAEEQLPESARRRICDARREAALALRDELAREPDPTVRTLIGLPTAEQALRLVDSLAVELWAEA